MKEFLLFICIILLYCPVFAQDSGEFKLPKGFKQTQNDGEIIDKNSPAELIWEGTESQIIEDTYGSDQSPYFEGRGGINPNESDYGYGNSDGN